jgi:hypothetical protein
VKHFQLILLLLYLPLLHIPLSVLNLRNLQENIADYPYLKRENYKSEWEEFEYSDILWNLCNSTAKNLVKHIIFLCGYLDIVCPARDWLT